MAEWVRCIKYVLVNDVHLHMYLFPHSAAMKDNGVYDVYRKRRAEHQHAM